jgi:hypothetical protein
MSKSKQDTINLPKFFEMKLIIHEKMFNLRTCFKQRGVNLSFLQLLSNNQLMSWYTSPVNSKEFVINLNKAFKHKELRQQFVIYSIENQIFSCGAVSIYLIEVLKKYDVFSDVDIFLSNDHANDHCFLVMHLDGNVWIVDFWISCLVDFDDAWRGCECGFFGTLQDFKKRIKQSIFFEHELVID